MLQGAQQTLVRLAASVGLGSLPPLDRTQHIAPQTRAPQPWTALNRYLPCPPNAAVRPVEADVRAERSIIAERQGH